MSMDDMCGVEERHVSQALTGNVTEGHLQRLSIIIRASRYIRTAPERPREQGDMQDGPYVVKDALSSHAASPSKELIRLPAKGRSEL